MSAPRPILIHGSGGDHRVWARQSARLEGAVALDLPGRRSGLPVTDATTMADACAAAVGGVPGPRVLVGHSLGGAVSAEVALRHPGVAEGLVLIASAARLPVSEAAVERARNDFAGERERLIAGFFADPATPMAGEARAALDACGPEVLAADYAACRGVEMRGRLGGVRIPVLVIAGADDPFTPVRIVEELARELPLARMVVVQGARHMPMAEFGDTVNGLIAAFLARLELTLQGT